MFHVAKLNARQCWPAVSPRVLMLVGQGFCAAAPHGLQLHVSFRCQVIPHLLLLSDSSHGVLFHGLGIAFIMIKSSLDFIV